MNGMSKKKRMNGLKTGGVVGILTQQALPIAVGYVAGDLLTKNLSFLSTNPTMGNLAKVAIGALVAANGGDMLAGVGVGVAANGVVSFAKPVFNLNGMGLLPPGQPSRYLAGTPGAQAMAEGSAQIKF